MVGGKLTPVANILPLVMAAPGAPTLVTAVDTSSTTGAAAAVVPPGVQFQKYIFTARPLNGGQPKVVEAATPQAAFVQLTAAFVQLTPATQYEVTVVGIANGAKSPTSNSLRFVMPAAGTPANAAKSLTSNVAEVVITPPLIGGPWTSFEVTVCPIGGPQALCIKTTCTTPTTCKLSGLRAMTTYVVSSVALKMVNGQGVRSLRSNEDTFTTPAAPLLVSAQAWGATTGQATATGALGEQYRQWVFTARPVKGGANVVVRNTAPNARFYGLKPSTEYEASAIGILVDGRSTAAPNLLRFTTPSDTSAVLVAADPNSSTKATIVLNPPAGDVVVEKYILALCLLATPAKSGRQLTQSPATCADSPCPGQVCPRVVECPTVQCEATGLVEGGQYSVTAEAVVDGKKRPVANSVPLSMPQLGAPTLVTAVDLGSTTGTALASPPDGVTYSMVSPPPWLAAMWPTA